MLAVALLAADTPWLGNAALAVVSAVAVAVVYRDELRALPRRVGVGRAV